MPFPQFDGGPIASFGMGPLEVLDFGISWVNWLPPGDLIVGTPTPTQDSGDGLLTINPDGNTTQVSNGVVTWWLSTPTVNVSYFVHVTIQTIQGRTSTRKIQIKGVPR
jgi:hypothetical protein